MAQILIAEQTSEKAITICQSLIQGQGEWVYKVKELEIEDILSLHNPKECVIKKLEHKTLGEIDDETLFQYLLVKRVKNTNPFYNLITQDRTFRLPVGVQKLFLITTGRPRIAS